MPQSENTDKTMIQAFADLGDSIFALLDVMQDGIAVANAQLQQSKENRVGADASGIADAGSKAALTARADMDAFSKAVNGGKNASNAFSKSLRRIFGLQAEGSKIVRDKMYGAGKAAEMFAATASRADRLWVDALDDFRRAADSASSLYAALRMLTGTVKLLRSTMGGSKGGAGSLASLFFGGADPLTWVLKLLGASALGQAMQMFSENFAAVKGGNAANAFQASAIAGGLYTPYESGMSVSDYARYRSEMRMRGMRDDQEIQNTLNNFALRGMFTAPGQAAGSDAYRAAISKQSIKAIFGMDLNDDFIGKMFRSTAGSRYNGMYDKAGLFNMSGYMAAVSKISSLSRSSSTGAFVGMSELNSIVEELSKSFLGTKQNIAGLLQSISAWKESLRDNKLSKEDLLGLYSGTNENMSLTQKLTAFAFAGMGSGNMLEEAWKWNERARTAGGKPKNLAYAAKSALDAYRGIGGTATSKDKMMIFSEQMLDQFGLGALKNNPEMISLLKNAAAGDRTAITTLEDLMKTDSDRLDGLSRNLDAIRNPVEHIRDYLFAKAFVPDLAQGRARAYEYEGMTAGYSGEDLEKYISARQSQDSYGIAADKNGKADEALLKSNLDAFTAQFKPLSETMQQLINRLNGWVKPADVGGAS